MTYNFPFVGLSGIAFHRVVNDLSVRTTKNVNLFSKTDSSTMVSTFVHG